MNTGTEFLDDNRGRELEDNISGEKDQGDDGVAGANVELEFLVHSGLPLEDGLCLLLRG